MAVEPEPRATHRALRLLVLLALAAATALWFNRKGESELPVYLTGALRALDGAEIYRTDDLKPFTYPPFFALPFVPLALLDEFWQRPVWALVNFGLLWFVLRALHRFFAEWLPAPRQRIVAWAIIVALAGRHLSAIFENQSHDLLVLACVVAAALRWARGCAASAGVWAGLGAACKATPALFGVLFALQLRWRAVLLATLVGVGASLLPDLVTPRRDGQLWAQAWLATMVASVRPGESADLQGTWSAGSILNQGLAGTVYRLTTPAPTGNTSPWVIDACLVELPPAARRYAVLGAQLLVLLCVAWCARRGATRDVSAAALPMVRLAQVAAVGCGMVLLSPMSSKSHFGVLMLPAALAAVLIVRGCRDLALLALAAGVFACGTLSTKGLLGSARGNWLLAHGSVSCTAVLALLLAWRAQVLWRRSA